MIQGLAVIKNNTKIIHSYQQHFLTEPFTAVTRYERAHTALEITYDPRWHHMEIHLYYGRTLRFALPEILHAARKMLFNISEKSDITDPHALEHVLTRFSRLVQKHASFLLEPPAQALERAQDLRAKHMERAIRRHYAKMLQETCQIAAKAYKDKDYKRVITLLSPHKDHLPKGELKKLHLAKKLLLS